MHFVSKYKYKPVAMSTSGRHKTIIDQVNFISEKIINAIRELHTVKS